MNASAGSDAPDQPYGVAGHPIGHSWSPFIHGMFAKATAQNLVYRLFDITPENFRREALRLFAGGLKGRRTSPCRISIAAAELVNELTPRAERAKAVNTIAFFEQTSLLGDNTDGRGLTADLEKNLGLALVGKRVLILGAGGAVRGVLGSLMERELREVVIANRTPERARKLAAEFTDLGEIVGCGFSEVRGPPYDLIINATSASLQGEMPEMPVGLVGEESIWLRHGLRPSATRRLRPCGPGNLSNAARTTKGWGMLVEQAAESFLLWRGIRPRYGTGARGIGTARSASLGTVIMTGGCWNSSIFLPTSGTSRADRGPSRNSSSTRRCRAVQRESLVYGFAATYLLVTLKPSTRRPSEPFKFTVPRY